MYTSSSYSAFRKAFLTSYCYNCPSNCIANAMRIQIVFIECYENFDSIGAKVSP